MCRRRIVKIYLDLCAANATKLLKTIDQPIFIVQFAQFEAGDVWDQIMPIDQV
jgi:hypothetical protein